MSEELGGIPLIVNEYMSRDELWLVQQGKHTEIHVHEGPRAGDEIEVWLQKPRVHRMVNLGDPWNFGKAPEIFGERVAYKPEGEW